MVYSTYIRADGSVGLRVIVKDKNEIPLHKISEIKRKIAFKTVTECQRDGYYIWVIE